MRAVRRKRSLLGAVVRQRRLTLGLVQGDVAEALSITPEAVGMLEAGRRQLALDRLPALAQALRVDAELLCKLGLYEAWPKLYKQLFGDQRPRVPDSSEF